MQHLNFYDQLDKTVVPLFSAKRQALVIAFVAVIMVIIYAALLSNKMGISNELEQLQRQQQLVASELEQLQAKKSRLERDSDLTAEISYLQNSIAFRRRLLVSIDPGDQSAENGFSAHLQGLARQHIKGMWFTEIQLQQGGRQLALMGETKAPEYVPRYVQKLTREEIFEGHQFRVLRLTTAETNSGLINFELRAKEIE